MATKKMNADGSDASDRLGGRIVPATPRSSSCHGLGEVFPAGTSLERTTAEDATRGRSRARSNARTKPCPLSTKRARSQGGVATPTDTEAQGVAEISASQSVNGGSRTTSRAFSTESMRSASTPEAKRGRGELGDGERETVGGVEIVHCDSDPPSRPASEVEDEKEEGVLLSARGGTLRVENRGRKPFDPAHKGQFTAPMREKRARQAESARLVKEAELIADASVRPAGQWAENVRRRVQEALERLGSAPRDGIVNDILEGAETVIKASRVSKGLSGRIAGSLSRASITIQAGALALADKAKRAEEAGGSASAIFEEVERLRVEKAALSEQLRYAHEHLAAAYSEALQKRASPPKGRTPNIRAPRGDSSSEWSPLSRGSHVITRGGVKKRKVGGGAPPTRKEGDVPRIEDRGATPPTGVSRGVASRGECATPQPSNGSNMMVGGRELPGTMAELVAAPVPALVPALMAVLGNKPPPSERSDVGAPPPAAARNGEAPYTTDEGGLFRSRADRPPTRITGGRSGGREAEKEKEEEEEERTSGPSSNRGNRAA